MASGEEFPVTLTIRAVDRATATIRAVGVGVAKMSTPLGRASRNVVDMGKAFRGVGKEAFALGTKVAAIAGVAGFGLYSLVRSATDAGDKLGEMSQRVGLGVDAYASLQFAAEQADVSQEQFTNSMDQLNVRLGMLKTGTGPLLAFLQKASPALLKQVKGAKSNEEAFGLLAKAMERVQDPGKRAALAGAAFGKANLQMGQFLGQGSAAIEEQRKRFLELSGSQEEFARRAGILDNTLRETEMAFGGVKNAVAAELFPAFNRMASMVTDFIVQNREGIIQWARDANAAFQAWANDGGFQRLTDGIRSMADTGKRLVDMLGGLKGVAIVVGAVLAGPLVGSIATLIGTFGPLLGLVFKLGVALMATPLGPFILAAAGLAAVAALIYENWEPVKTFFLSLGDIVKHPLEALKTAKEFFFGKSQGAATFAGGNDVRPTVNTEQAAPNRGGVGTGQLDVNFNNVPRGTRMAVSPDSTLQINTSMGYGLAGGGY
jgi:hypothetical protein